jgi:hypothetical protein
MIGTGLIFLIRAVPTVNPIPGLTAARVCTILSLVSHAAIIAFAVGTWLHFPWLIRITPPSPSPQD